MVSRTQNHRIVVTSTHPELVSEPHKLTLATIVLLAFGALSAILAASSPMGVNGLHVLAGGAALLWWLGRLLAFAVYSKRYWRHVPPFPHRGLLIWAVEPLLLLSTFWLCHQQLPLRLRFEASRPALERYVQFAASPRAGSLPTPSGARLYTVREAEVWPSGARMLTTDIWSFLGTDRAGFLYCPEGRPEGYYEEATFTHLEGPWYAWCQPGW